MLTEDAPIAIGNSVCICDGIRNQQYIQQLTQLPARSGTWLAGKLVKRRCALEAYSLDGAWKSGNSSAGSRQRCAAARIAELVLCSQSRLLQRDILGMWKFLERANLLIPQAAACPAVNDWTHLIPEFYDNFRNIAYKLGEYVTPKEEEREGFFSKPIPEDEFARRVAKKVDELMDELQWRKYSHVDSRAREFEQRRMYPEPSIKKSEAGVDADKPCGMLKDVSPSQKRRRKAAFSKARPISPSRCVWLLENACIDDRRIVLFGKGQAAREFPRSLLSCGEFGSYDFNAIEVQHPRTWKLFQQNMSGPPRPETLLVVPGMMSGVSAHNPFHILHSTVPVVWQLHHPSYGLCIPRDALDVRFAFLSQFHGKRQVHFWRAFTNQRPPPHTPETLNSRFQIAAGWRFWWGPIADHPPLPLGADPTPRCYERIIFGRELFRTGIGGFVTPRVMNFYHRYLDAALDRGGAKQQSPLVGDSEWRIWELMVPGVERASVDPMALEEFRARYSAPFFDAATNKQANLAATPFRIWEVQDPQDKREPVPTRLVRSAQSAATDALNSTLQLHVLVVQRSKGAGRWIANVDDVVRWAENFEHEKVQLALLIIDLEKLHPATQWNLAAQTDVLVGVTGAALAWTAFLPRWGVVLDIFPPFSNSCTEGWGNNPVSHYGGLARLSGLKHTCMVHPAALHNPVANKEDEGRQARKEVREKLGGFWHGQNIRLDLTKFNSYFLEAVSIILEAKTSEPS